jgi:hypothetical protein
MITVLSEAVLGNRDTFSRRELLAMTETARLLGCPVHTIPRNFDACGTAENALAHVPIYDPPVPGVWIGFIPPQEHYTAIYDAAFAKGIRLLNTSEQHQIVMEFDRYYPLLSGLTPESVVCTSTVECVQAGQALGFPVFVRGAVKSNKEQGWAACVANDPTELEHIVGAVLARDVRSRGKVIVRKLVHLRRLNSQSDHFPVTREYRVFMYRDQVLAQGFYWDEYDDNRMLSSVEQSDLKGLAVEAACRLQVPFIIADIGQLDSGQWILIEVGDAQFAGLSRIPVLELWGKIKDITIDG